MSSTRTFTATTLGPSTTGSRLLLCPTTALFTVPFTLYSLLLSYRVCKLRQSSNTPNAPVCCHGSKTCDPKSPECAQKCDTATDPLYLATRAHGNYIENVPLAMLIGAVAELNGGDRKTLGWALTGLALLRVAHVECGLRREGGLGRGRAWGYWGTGVWMVGMVGWCAVLGRPSDKRGTRKMSIPTRSRRNTFTIAPSARTGDPAQQNIITVGSSSGKKVQIKIIHDPVDPDKHNGAPADRYDECTENRI
ncbi:hypothetical protein EX30DRAFT_367120 [Ascodesmis nigricans]|uniref:Uncharacterized protein n=1 Tax=Ascodesmis nigricans TaxID=341454 RepID=A0A4V6RHA7_9PEZI|nr:hypothetical protein EX30DRAFT_367120 [Ascodesmis nigricans]